MVEINQPGRNDFDVSAKKEWLITNGIGGYASSTVTGQNSRRYHGLLVAATHPPVGRLVMLSKLEDAIIVDGVRIDLATNVYGEGAVHSHGYQNLENFRLDLFPVYTYSNDRFALQADAGLGQISEIFDAEEPHNPRGCIAQAWSVAELLRLAKLVSRQSQVPTAHTEETAQLASVAD